MHCLREEPVIQPRYFQKKDEEIHCSTLQSAPWCARGRKYKIAYERKREGGWMEGGKEPQECRHSTSPRVGRCVRLAGEGLPCAPTRASERHTVHEFPTGKRGRREREGEETNLRTLFTVGVVERAAAAPPPLRHPEPGWINEAKNR